MCKDIQQLNLLFILLYFITWYTFESVESHLEWLLFRIHIKPRKAITMDGYGNRLLQTARDKFFGISWSTVFGVLILICFTTRIVSGLQSRRQQDPSKLKTVRLAPYWFPWIGHGPAFLWNHVSFFKRTRCVLPVPCYNMQLLINLQRIHE